MICRTSDMQPLWKSHDPQVENWWFKCSAVVLGICWWGVMPKMCFRNKDRVGGCDPTGTCAALTCEEGQDRASRIEQDHPRVLAVPRGNGKSLRWHPKSTGDLKAGHLGELWQIRWALWICSFQFHLSHLLPLETIDLDSHSPSLLYRFGWPCNQLWTMKLKWKSTGVTGKAHAFS